jgi:hypothetical protein
VAVSSTIVVLWLKARRLHCSNPSFSLPSIFSLYLYHNRQQLNFEENEFTRNFVEQNGQQKKAMIKDDSWYSGMDWFGRWSFYG